MRKAFSTEARSSRGRYSRILSSSSRYNCSMRSGGGDAGGASETLETSGDTSLIVAETRGSGAAHRNAVDRAPAIGVTFGSVMQIVVQRMLAAALVWCAADPSAADPFAAKRDRMGREQIEAPGVGGGGVVLGTGMCCGSCGTRRGNVLCPQVGASTPTTIRPYRSDTVSRSRSHSPWA